MSRIAATFARLKDEGRKALIPFVTAGDPEPARTGTARILFSLAEGPLEVPAYERARLRAGNRLQGPALVHEMDSTVVVSPGWAGEVLGDGTIRLRRKEA